MDVQFVYLPSVRRLVKVADFVVEKSLHGEPIQGLVGAATDVRVVHVGGYHDSDTVSAAPAHT